jgi:SAM-dependent methyltransferase
MNGAGDPRSEVKLFMKSRALLSAAELDLFTILDESPKDASALASRLGLHERALTRLLDCLVTFGLLAKTGGIYRPSEDGRALSSRHPESVLPSLLHYNHLWNNWSHLTESVRLGENPHRDRVKKREGARLEAFIGTMHVVGRELSAKVAAAYNAARFTRLLDIGAGAATYTTAFLKRNSRMTAVVFDLPEVIPLAERRLREEGLIDRATSAPGDFYTDELPAGCDLALLSAIIHQNSPEQNLDLYKKVHRALAPGGVLLIRDHIMNEERTEPADGALFALNMLVCTDGGDTYTFAETRDALLQAGFGRINLVRCGGAMDCLVEAAV